MKRIIVASVVGSCVLLSLASHSWAVSGAGAINLVFPIGARYNGMGEAGVALAQDATASWWNPGGLAFLADRGKSKDLHIMQTPLAQGLADDINLYWIGYAGPWGAGNFGLNLNYLSMGEQIATDEQGNEIGTFKSYEYAITASYGLKVSPNVGIGFGVKYFRDRLAQDEFLQDGSGGSGDSFGVDLGVLWKVPSWRMNLAAAITNLGPDIKHVDQDQSDPMPRKFTTGLAFSVFSSEASALLLVGDYSVPLLKWDSDKQDYGYGAEFGEEEFGAGAEWSYVQSLFFRIGYKSAKAGDIEDYTWGFGVDLWRWLGQGIGFDYASVPQAKGLDRVNRFSLLFRF